MHKSFCESENFTPNVAAVQRLFNCVLCYMISVAIAKVTLFYTVV